MIISQYHGINPSLIGISKTLSTGILKILIFLNRGSTCVIERLHSDHNHSISPNTLNRDFEVTEPNKVWATDITYVWTLEGWLYVAVVIDLFSRQVMSWTVDGHMRTSLCVRALQMSFWRKTSTRYTASLR
ncbi:MAG: DDE-type integrase/transposase/recombinase [Candidatus Methanofishera endochildressiae]|uniref:DDE-type integrase/transposase/recombinase n=1 Tax=Candidatus Methanofishera endochildressiae TaxID=2738884 RepID=A0A7Z0MP25_9GAMM|nr:DDE-type integrase/transposase/recombinase [Candidatus Methanofishera endochildressiae]